MRVRLGDYDTQQPAVQEGDFGDRFPVSCLSVLLSCTLFRLPALATAVRPPALSASQVQDCSELLKASARRSDTTNNLPRTYRLRESVALTVADMKKIILLAVVSPALLFVIQGCVGFEKTENPLS